MEVIQGSNESLQLARLADSVDGEVDIDFGTGFSEVAPEKEAEEEEEEQSESDSEMDRCTLNGKNKARRRAMVTVPARTARQP